MAKSANEADQVTQDNLDSQDLKEHQDNKGPEGITEEMDKVVAKAHPVSLDNEEKWDNVDSQEILEEMVLQVSLDSEGPTVKMACLELMAVQVLMVLQADLGSLV